MEFRAKNVKNKAIINKDVSQKALMSAYQEEIKRLKEQLEGKGGGVQSIDEDKLEREKVAHSVLIPAVYCVYRLK